MKLIVAVIRPENLVGALTALRIPGASVVSVSHVVSDGGEPGPTLLYRGRQVPASRPMLRLEVAVPDQLADRAVEVVVRTAFPPEAAHTGELKVLVLPIEACILSVPADEPPYPVNRRRDVPVSRRG